MKTTLFILFALVSQLAFSQAAGNWYYNQKMESKGMSNSNYDNYNAYPVQAQTSYGYYNTNTISDSVILIETNVLMNVQADGYVAILGVTQVGDSVETCHKLINQRINRFIKNIEKLGIKTEDIYIDFISQVPVFEYELESKLFSKNYIEIPKGFEIKKNIHIKYNDEKIADKLLTEAAKNEIYDIVKVDYIINNTAAIYDSLRSAASKIMNEKMNDFKKLGVKFNPIYNTVAESLNSSYPIEHYSSYNAFNNPTVNALNKNNSLKYSKGNDVNLYYNRMPYNSYDQVINPFVIEPAVQFTYKLQMKYLLKKQL